MSTNLLVCPCCHRCGCGAGGFDTDELAEAHEAMHAGQYVEPVAQPSEKLADPNIGTDTLLHILLGPQVDALSNVCAYVERLHALVRWLGRTYGGNEPTWPPENLYGHELPENRVLASTWRGVMGGDAVSE